MLLPVSYTHLTKYLFWGIDELTSMTEQVLLNEYLFEDDIKSDLRRSLYFYEEDVNFVYYKKLLEKLILKINKMCIRDRNNILHCLKV